MRIAFPIGTRSTPIDRNPSTVSDGINAEVTNGATTTLTTYTVPANRRADVAIQVGSVIKTALAAAQNASATITFTPSGGGIRTLWRSQYFPTQGVGVRDDSPSIHLQMKAGDNILTQIQADAGAGILQGAGGVQGVEYDA